MTSDLNVVILTGRVTVEPDYGKTRRGTPTCTFGVGVKRYYRGEEGPVREETQITVSTWGLLAEQCARHLTRGLVVRLEGQLRHARWPERGKMTVVADVVVWAGQGVELGAAAPEDLEPAEEVAAS